MKPKQGFLMTSAVFGALGPSKQVQDHLQDVGVGLNTAPKIWESYTGIPTVVGAIACRDPYDFHLKTVPMSPASSSSNSSAVGDGISVGTGISVCTCLQGPQRQKDLQRGLELECRILMSMHLWSKSARCGYGMGPEYLDLQSTPPSSL